MYLCKKATAVLDAHGRLCADDAGNPFVAIGRSNGSSYKAAFQDTPSRFEPANLVGLCFISKFGLSVSESSFAFGDPLGCF
jgi:hypothetical protein